LRRIVEGRLHLVQGASLPLGPDRDLALPVDLVLVDLASAMLGAAELADLRIRYAEALVVGLLPPAEADEPPPAGAEQCPGGVPTDLPAGPLRGAIAHALRGPRREQEVATLRRERARPEPRPAPAPEGPGGSLGTVLKEMGKLLAAHFDLDRVVDFFLDAITELVRPGRAALLLADDQEPRYRVRGQRGLDPALTRELWLRRDDGLPAWFRRHAR